MLAAAAAVVSHSPRETQVSWPQEPLTESELLSCRQRGLFQGGRATCREGAHGHSHGPRRRHLLSFWSRGAAGFRLRRTHTCGAGGKIADEKEPPWPVAAGRTLPRRPAALCTLRPSCRCSSHHGRVTNRIHLAHPLPPSGTRRGYLVGFQQEPSERLFAHGAWTRGPWLRLRVCEPQALVFPAGVTERTGRAPVGRVLGTAAPRGREPGTCPCAGRTVSIRTAALARGPRRSLARGSAAHGSQRPPSPPTRDRRSASPSPSLKSLCVFSKSLIYFRLPFPFRGQESDRALSPAKKTKTHTLITGICSECFSLRTRGSRTAKPHLTVQGRLSAHVGTLTTSCFHDA